MDRQTQQKTGGQRTIERGVFRAWITINCGIFNAKIDALERRLVWAALTLRQHDPTRAEIDFIKGTIAQGEELTRSLALFESYLMLVKSVGLRMAESDRENLLRR